MPNPEQSACAVIAAVQLPSVSDTEFESSLAELRDLAKTLGFTITATFTQKRASFDAGAYLGSGMARRLEGARCRFHVDELADFLALAGAEVRRRIET